ncbi:MAG TPA: methyltransferase domain-containing protein [Dehalococcoidia bacterium]|nr:methyltransferase domain-containing protein [Dehalococcoidia bacterium]
MASEEMASELRAVNDFYDAPSIAWSLRGAGLHLHAGSEDATVAQAQRLEAYGYTGGGRILEIASALGGPARYLARRFLAMVLCIDANPRMHAASRATAAAEGLTARTPLLLARTEALPLVAASCDVAWSQDAMCHMDKPAVVREVARVLRPLGLFAFSDWVARAELTPEERAELARVWSFPALLRLSEYVRLLDESGFDVLLAEDRTTILSARPQVDPPDQQAWEGAFAAAYGAAELERQREPFSMWRALVRAGRTGYASFVARKRAVA